MKALFGVVSLLVALAVVGLVAVKQLKAVGSVGASAGAQAGVSATSAVAGSGNVREQSQQLQRKVQDDVKRALEQGAAARSEQADK
jgi:elongation factor P hydroxylase